MEQVGAKLREARVARGMSVEDIAQVTKVPRTALIALESGSRDVLPALVFVKGFVRAYARAVGLDPGPYVRQLEAEAHAAELAHLGREGDGPRTPSSRRHTATDPSVLPLAAAASGVRRATGVRRGYVLLVAVAAGLLLAAWLMVGGRRDVGPAQSGTASPTTPILQDHVDGVSSMTEDDPPDERLR